MLQNKPVFLKKEAGYLRCVPSVGGRACLPGYTPKAVWIYVPLWLGNVKDIAGGVQKNGNKAVQFARFLLSLPVGTHDMHGACRFQVHCD